MSDYIESEEKAKNSKKSNQRIYINHLYKKKLMTLDDVADKADISLSQLHKFRSGENACTIDHAANIAKAVDAYVSDIIDPSLVRPPNKGADRELLSMCFQMVFVEIISGANHSVQDILPNIDKLSAFLCDLYEMCLKNSTRPDREYISLFLNSILGR